MHDRDSDTDQLLAQAGWLQGLARRLAGPAGADDLVQDVWLQVAQRRPERIESPRGWLATVMRSVHLRRRERRDASQARERASARPEALPSAAELAGRADAQRALVATLLELEEPWRRTLLLHFFDGVSAAEIARRDGESASTVRARIARGVDSLRARLDSERGGREVWLPGVVLLGWPEGPPPAASVLTGASTAPLALPLTGVAMWKLVAGLSAVLVVVIAVRLGAGVEPPTADIAARVEDGPPAELASPEIAPTPEPERVALAQGSEPEAVAPESTAFRDDLPASTLVGVVVDPAGRPVEAATVAAGTLQAYGLHERGYGDPVSTVETDADGRFTLALGESVDLSEPMTLTAHAEGFASSEESVIVPAALGESQLALRPGGRVEGVVFGLDGSPVAGRPVQIASTELGEFQSVTTDDDGVFELSALTPGAWRAATMPTPEEMADQGEETEHFNALSGLAQLEFWIDDEETLAIELGRVTEDTPRVFGTLTLDGRPVRLPMQWYPVGRPSEKRVATADAAGDYAIDLPRPGRWVVLANAFESTSRGLRVEVDLVAGEERELHLVLDGLAMSGRVVDPAGTPVVGAKVELRAAGDTPHLPPPTIGGAYERTDDEGRYRFAPLQPGTWRVVVHGTEEDDEHGWAGAVGRPVAVVDGDVDAGDLALPTGARIEVEVRDRQGRRAKDASLWFHGPEGVPLNPITETRTDMAGRATSPVLPLGPVAVTAIHASGASETVLVEVGVDTSVALDLGTPLWIDVVRKSVPIDDTTEALRVRDAAGREWGGRLDIQRIFDALPEREDEQRPLFGPLPPGTYTVRCGDASATVILSASSPTISSATLD